MRRGREVDGRTGGESPFVLPKEKPKPGEMLLKREERREEGEDELVDGMIDTI